ncbi:MAG TPA: hypothetical protein VJS64_17365, partial [Pyrinomonadaceae bacterium]|nr:hypothetical protein [Pyrinomonadaceae bacterium]
KKTPNFFYPIGGKPLDLEKIDETVIISLPMRLPQDERLIYGILNLSSKDTQSKLQDIRQPRVLDDISEFRAVLNLACYEALDKRIFARGRP